MDEVSLSTYRDMIAGSSRYDDPKRLTRYGYKVYSQCDEDGLLAEIFRRIGVHSRSFVEFGVENGLECNSLWLLAQDWRGLWIEASEAACDQIRKSHASWLQAGQLTLRQAFITRENIDALIEPTLTGEIDLLSIDLDGNDYWIWDTIRSVRPRVVAIEYIATWRPPVCVTVPYLDDARWDGSNYFGASLSALGHLATRKGYQLVGCTLSGVNAFFVRNDLLGDHFHAPGDVPEHYEPARYALCALPAGHRPGIGPLVVTR